MRADECPPFFEGYSRLYIGIFTSMKSVQDAVGVTDDVRQVDKATFLLFCSPAGMLSGAVSVLVFEVLGISRDKAAAFAFILMLLIGAIHMRWFSSDAVQELSARYRNFSVY
jgi:hypothetical protein